MSEPIEEHFPDDPRLNQALRSLYANETASEDLRAKVWAVVSSTTDASVSDTSLQTTATSDQAPSWSQLLFARVGLTLAAAAAIAMVWGFFFYDDYKAHREEQALVAGNIDFLSAMLQTHNTGVGPEDEPIHLALTDPAALAAAASTTLKRDVPVPRLSGDWRLTDAGYCTLGGHRVARFSFVCDSKKVTLLSMSTYSWYGEAGKTDYALRVNQQPIAGYLKSQSLNCVVGSEDMDLDTLVRLRDSLRGS
jgi:hypothetical protein